LHPKARRKCKKIISKSSEIHALKRDEVELLDAVFLIAEDDRPGPTDFYLIQAEAGSGKTLLLRRLAWEAADGNLLCLFLRQAGSVRIEPLRELHRLTNERIFLFVDNAADHCDDLQRVATDARRLRLPLTIVAAARTNEWNISCGDAQRYVTEAFPLRYLSKAEIEKLVDLLEKNDAVGPNLRQKTTAQKIAQFEERAGRQILVALHEATLGQPFEKILIDEFLNIQPGEARALYLTVCALNRLDLPVRAGLIARVHGISFEQFDKRFLMPLEHVVIAQPDAVSGDMAYRARHPEIAEIVFEKILVNPSDRFNEYVRVVKSLNRSFNSDNQAFRILVRARTLHEYFPRYEDVRDIFRVAEESNGRDAFLCQQMANYERIRPNGNLRLAFALLEEARKLDPRDMSIVHTLAELTRTQAETSETALERRRYRTQAVALLRPLLETATAAYARGTLTKLAIDELEDTLTDKDSSDRAIDDAVRIVEKQLEAAAQTLPADHFVRLQEERFARLLDDDKRALRALKAANDANSRDPYIARRLALIYKKRGQMDLARQCIETALASNRGDKLLNFALGELIWTSEPRDVPAAIYHFRRAFIEGDTNYEAQFWYARCAFDSSDPAERELARSIFRRLRNAPVKHDDRTQLIDIVQEGGVPKSFAGKIIRLENRHGMIERDGDRDWIFFHSSKQDPATWAGLQVGERVRFNVGYTLTGPQAFDLESLRPR
jgi:tetratricopeptide (TPR) repeat protein/cold shock CspA family protein